MFTNIVLLISLQIFDDHYHFEHKTLVKRSISPSHHHQRRLNDDDRVVWSKQQRAKSRQKRDSTRLKPPKSFTGLLNDPRWPSMWYLVSTKFQSPPETLQSSPPLLKPPFSLISCTKPDVKFIDTEHEFGFCSFAKNDFN